MSNTHACIYNPFDLLNTVLAYLSTCAVDSAKYFLSPVVTPACASAGMLWYRSSAQIVLGNGRFRANVPSFILYDCVMMYFRVLSIMGCRPATPDRDALIIAAH